MNQHSSNYGRIIAVLDEVIADPGPRGVRQLSETTGVARSTVGRILHSLTDAGVVESTSIGDYQAGPRLQILMDAVRRRHPLLQAVRARADGLAHRMSSTAVLSVFDPVRGQAFIAFTHRRAGPVEYALEVGAFVPLHAGSVGQAIAMSTGTQILEDTNLEVYTPETIRSRAELDKSLSESRKRGYAISAGQHIELAAGAAAPLRAYGITGSVSVSGPKYSTTEEVLHEIGASLVQVTRDIATTASKYAMSVSEPVVGFPGGSTSVPRFLRLIALVVAALPGGVQQGPKLAAALGSNIATTRKLQEELFDNGLLSRSENMVFVGPLLLLWSSRMNPARRLADYAEPFLRKLSAETGETVALFEYDARTEEAVVVRVLRGSRPASYGLSAGGNVPLHAGALGKAILANCARGVLERLHLERHTERTICSRDQLYTELSRINSRGYALSDSERMPDAFGIGAAIFQDGAVIGSMGITIARSRHESVDIESVGAKVQAAARALSNLLSIESLE